LPRSPRRCSKRRTWLLRDAAFIDGAWVTGEHTFDVTNPADGSLVGTVPALGAAEATLAVDAAARAQPAWARLTGQARARSCGAGPP
jgi:succinate-semialdehyde dehydrogenase/glutarate-semialdehyde dehydrogenase